MSVYYDKKRRQYVVSRFENGMSHQLGHFDNEVDAEIADLEWQEDQDEAIAEDNLMYTHDWYQSKHRQQKELYKKYPPYKKD